MSNALDPIASASLDSRLSLGGVAGSRLGSSGQLAALEMAPGSGQRPTLDQALGLFQNVLVDQMVKSMRAAVPKSGLLGDDSGREMFESFLDAEYSKALGEQMGDTGLVEALKRQLGVADSQPALLLPRPWATSAADKMTHPVQTQVSLTERR